MSSRFYLPIFFAMVLLGLAGCASPAMLRARDEATCRGYGFQPNTSAFAACLQRENLARRYGGYGGPWIYGAY